MKKFMPLLMALSILCVPALAAWAEDEEVVHTVKKGDTLWDISNKYMKTPWNWPLIWSNNENITNPHLIYPGDKVILSKKDGKYQVTIVPANGGDSQVMTLKDFMDVKGKTLALSPDLTSLLYLEKPPTGKGTVVGKQDLGIYSVTDDIILVKMPGEIDATKAKGMVIATPITAVKKGDVTLGYFYRVVGLAKIKDIQNGIVRGRLTYANQEVKVGDVAVEVLNPLKPATLKVNLPTLTQEGTILNIYGGVVGGTTGDAIMIDLGTKQGVSAGSLLSIYETITVKGVEGAIEDYRGMCIVLKALDNSCLAYVVDSREPLKKGFKLKAK